jgi:hypothetical protein
MNSSKSLRGPSNDAWVSVPQLPPLLPSQVSSAVATQRLWSEPKKVVEKYAAGESEEGDAGKVRTVGSL